MFGRPSGAAGRFTRAAFASFAIAAVCASVALAQDALLEKRGTEIDARVVTALDSKTAHSGDAFALNVTDTLFNHHPELRGSRIDGHLEDVVPASPTHRAAMSVIFDDIAFADGRTEPIAVSVKNMSALEPRTHHVRDLGIIVGSAVVGHMMSKKTGHGGGTLAGAAAGFAIASALKSDIVIKPGTLIKLRLRSDLPQPE
jgi:hypothetical protein